MAHGDCETCIHYGDDDYCFDCDYFERDTYDKYEEASPEKTAAIEAERQKQFEESAIDSCITLNVTEEFRNSFNTVKQFTANIHHKSVFICVYASSDNHLVATDTRCLIEYKCDDVPLSLQNRCIVRLEDYCAKVHDKLFPSYKPIFDGVMGLTLPLSEVKTRIWETPCQEFPTVEGITQDCGIVYFNKYQMDLIRKTLTGDKMFKHAGQSPVSPILISGDNGRSVLVPLRVKSTYGWKEVKSDELD